MKKAGIFFKVLVAAIVLHGTVCVTMSYMLAWRDHTEVVEGLSQTIITEIIAPIIVYGVTKTIENIFSKNKLPFSTPIAYLKELAEEEKQSENAEIKGEEEDLTDE